MRILFILKKKSFGSGSGPSSGLFNSATFVSNMLREELHQDSKLVVVDDNNDIDREITLFRPKLVIIEAIWVVPEKFRVLVRLHPRVKFIIRNHSALPFLAHEGMAMAWMLRYIQERHVEISCNDPRTNKEFEELSEAAFGEKAQVHYLPNYYPPEFFPRERKRHQHHRKRNHLAVGCFGAIRGLKNQLLQAVAAVRFAELTGKNLNYHINVARVECGGEPILRNIRSLFSALPRHKLFEHHWLGRPEFLALVREMDLGLQCSYSETFNVITADFVMNDVPVVVSSEISWVSPEVFGDPNSSTDITGKIAAAFRNQHRHRSVKLLQDYDRASIRTWKRFLESQ